MGVEESPGSIMGISIRITMFMMKPVIPHPVYYRVLEAYAAHYHEKDL